VTGFRLPAGIVLAGALWLGFRLDLHLGNRIALVIGLGALVLAALPRPPGRRGLAALDLAAVVMLGTAAGALRWTPVVPLASEPRTSIAGRVIAWEPTTAGVQVDLLAFRVGTRSLSPPRPVRLLADDAWGEAPRSGWVCAAGRLEGTRAGTVPGTETAPARAGTLRADDPPRWGPGNPPALGAARLAVREAISRRFTGFTARFGEAMLLGRGRALTLEERDRFRRTGTGHLVAVSGFNVALAAVLVGLVLAPAPVRVRYAGVVLAAWAYAAMAAWAPSGVRAAAMLSAAAAGAALGRPRRGIAWLALALPWLLWADPRMAASLSFRLSVTAVLGILFLLDLAGSRGRRVAVSSVLTTVGAQWGTLPATLATFGAVAPASIVPNLVAVPIAALLLPAVGLSLALSGCGVDRDPFGESVRVLTALLDLTLRLGARHLPFVSGIAAPPPVVEWGAWMLPLVWFGLPAAVRHRPRARVAGAAGAVLVLAAAVVPLPPEPGPWVAFLDVGQGDAAVLRMGDGTTWIVDVGDDRGPGDAAQNAISPFLRRCRIRRVDGLVLSHRHRDHVGGLATLLDTHPVARVYDTGLGPPTGTPGWVDSVLAAHARWPCLVAAGDTLHAGREASVIAHHPGREEPTAWTPRLGLNDASLVLSVRDGPLTVCFAGDAEAWAESAVASREGALRAAILKVGHHGSRTSSSEAFLQAVAPEWGVVSVGEGNRFGHPDADVLSRLGARRVRVHRTDREGTVIFRVRDGRLVAQRFPPLPFDAPVP
jgi:competence protein ComEC